MKKTYIDLHCHPSLKPFGKSFQRRRTTGLNNPDPKINSSIWHEKRPKLFKKALNVFFRLTKWRQSDFTTLLNGNTNVIVTSLYPMEKGMVIHKNSADVKYSGRIFRNLATGISMRRVRHLQNMEDYFKDLLAEYDYFKQLHNTPVKINGKTKTYKLVSSVNDIDFSVNNVLHVIMSIEGAHVFNCGLRLAGRPKANPTEVLLNVSIVKQWKFQPFFIGLAHHFDNEICGFSKSFSGIVEKVITQKPKSSQGITPLGFNVIKELLNDSNGWKRIYVDVKHMNPKSRYDYYELLDTAYKNEDIPIIVSHGALNGRLHPDKHSQVWRKGFNSDDINFYFDEIQKIESSNGIFGIQLDERRIFDKNTKQVIYDEAKKEMTKFGKPKLRKQSYFIWRQIQFIATYLDTLNRDAWNIQALGTDFDGIIDPLNGWWTAKELKDLPKYLISHAQDFLNSDEGLQLKTKNKLTAETIIDKLMTLNAQQFLKTYFK